ncbi:MAG: enoyl-CoA hydratase [Xanthobacteraceae bacterium]|nr:enoyl-CoA hydratase [Xanthobacteraceae bacterium]QYK46507.1 MAG: enoyl-CoA hydratase [Xanthobacteraceae bacterium]
MTPQTALAQKPDAAPIILREDHGPVAMLVLNRPAARNSLSQAMIDTLTAEIAKVRDDKAVRALIIAANGPGFCAGHDMKEMTARRTDSDRGRAFFEHMFKSCAAMMMSIVNLPKPVIAAVGGAASAAGCQLVASCDLAVASKEARFATPGVDIGLFCSTPMVALSRNVTNKHAMEMLLTGDLISAQRAYEIGLVNRVVDPDSERHGALELANQIASKSAHTLKIGKEAFYRQRELDLESAYRYTAQVMTENMLARDAEEGIGAFVEKRTPKWEDR